MMINPTVIDGGGNGGPVVLPNTAPNTAVQIDPITTAPADFSYIQTFYIDSQSVNKSSVVSLTSIELYFKRKPPQNTNQTGSQSPGVVVQLCQVSNDVPDSSKLINGSSVRVAYENIYPYSDASTSTKFTFTSPIVLSTDTFYGILLKFEDPGYEVWSNKTGDTYVGTSTVSTGSNNLNDGKFYQQTNDTIYRAYTDVDLKYKVNVAKFLANTATFSLVNGDYEFLSVGNILGSFIAGERVYTPQANQTGNVIITQGNTTITGVGTNFSSLISGQYIVCSNGTFNQVLKVDYASNSTVLVSQTVPSFTTTTGRYSLGLVGKVDSFDSRSSLTLANSTANSSLLFAPNTTVVGERSGATANITSVNVLGVDQVIPQLHPNTTSHSSSNGIFNFSYNNGTNYVYSNSNFKVLTSNTQNSILVPNSVIMSKSLEVVDSLIANNKSATVNVSCTIDSNTDLLFHSFSLNANETDLYILGNDINNVYIANNIDTEVGVAGLARCKNISQKISFANNRFAEDIKVYLTGYRPIVSDIRVYAKLHNSADTNSFSDLSWTPLQITQNANRYSSSENPDDLVEYEYSLSQYPESSSVVGMFTSVLSNNVVTIQSGTANAAVSTNDLVKLYSPLFPNNYMISVVTAANSTTLTLADAVSNNNVVGSGLYIDKLKYKNVAFNNAMNYNICRYYNTAMVPFDTYDTLQVKVVLLSNNTNLVPKVDQIQVIGVSA